MKKILLIALMAVIMLPFNADSQKRNRQQRKSTHKSAQQKTQQVFEEIDEEDAKTFAYSYFKRDHSCYDLSKNKKFFTAASYKVLSAKINKMLRNYELESEGEDPFLYYTSNSSKEGFGVVVTSLGDGIFVCEEAVPTVYGEFDDDPYDIIVACIKVVKVNGEYKIGALFDLPNKKWVPGNVSLETANDIKEIIERYSETPQKENSSETPQKENSSETPQKEDDVVFTSCTTMPSFPGGDTALMNFLRDHLRYPEEAVKNNVQGKVIVQFVVEKDGKIGKVKIAKGVSKELDRESVRVVKSLPSFSPGLNSDGDPVRVWYTLPITFNLQSNSSN